MSSLIKALEGASSAAPQGEELQGREERWPVLPAYIQLWLQVSVLIILGLIMIYSSSSMVALKKYGDSAYFLKRQLIWIGLGIGVMVVCSRIDYDKYKHWIGFLLIGTIASLLLVLIPGLGAEINNARRWFKFGFLQLQPGEYAKTIWVIYLSISLAKKQDRIRQFTIGFLPHMVMCGIFALLLLKEPDFGTTFILSLMTFLMLLAGGVPIHFLLLLVPVGLIGAYRFVYLVPYRWERVTAFLDPWTDRLDSGYQLIQAWIAVGSGGLLGKGLGAGQQKLYYLPESYTDFILAVIGEELGLLGIIGICVVFLFIFRTGITISRNARDLTGSLMAVGLTMLIIIQALVNMGVVLGLFPTKGLTLPFISYGGSAFTANCTAMGVLMNIARNTERRA